jgi:multiple sugar transport system permease protein
VTRLKKRLRRHREAILGYLYLSPFILGFLIFTAGPMLASLGLSFTEYRVMSPPRWVGVQNYKMAFLDDPLFWPSLKRTFTYTLITTPLVVAGSLALALLLNQGVKGTTWFRTAFFLPHLTPMVAAALLWLVILDPDGGVLNYLLSLAGIEGPGWFTSPRWAIPALIVVSTWMGVGGNRMLIFLAGLQGVPQSLYDAARVDGATAWQRFLYVTLPMISPALFFNLVLALIGHLRVFTAALVATRGGPAYATWFFSLHIYTQAFQYFEMGYGSALAWIFMLVLLSLTYLQFRLAGGWVYYEGNVQS